MKEPPQGHTRDGSKIGRWLQPLNPPTTKDRATNTLRRDPPQRQRRPSLFPYAIEGTRTRARRWQRRGGL
jgi:hypothetical protein